MILMNDQSKFNKIKSMGLISAKTLQEYLGISQPTLSRLVANGKILRLSYGVYAHPDLKISPEEIDFAVACARFGPMSAIGGLSALFHYGLTDQPPSQIWVIAPSNKSDHNSLYRAIRLNVLTKAGIDSFKFYRITNIERTIIECLRFSSKIGQRVGIYAARTALERRLTTQKKLEEMARNLDEYPTLEKFWEAIVA